LSISRNINKFTGVHCIYVFNENFKYSPLSILGTHIGKLISYYWLCCLLTTSHILIGKCDIC